MIHKWEIKQFVEGSKVEYRIRLKCQEEDLIEFKKFLQENNINISKEFRSLSSNFNFVLYLNNVEENEIKKLSIVLRNVCNDGEYVSQVNTSTKDEEDGLKYLYELLKDIYELPMVDTSKTKKTEYYDLLKETSKMISSVSDFNQLTKILFKITKQLNFNKAIILLRDEDMFNFVDGYGIDFNITGSYKLELSIGEMIKEMGKIVTKDKILPEIVQSQELFNIFPVGMIISLVSDKNVEGFIILDDKPSLKTSFQEDCELLEIISGQISAVIQNLRLAKEAITDALTGVYRYNYFIKRLNEEIYRSKLYKHPLSLLMIDLDNFKQVNDTYGHQIGNIVLKEIAKILKENTRISDVVCRYGGDEFSIIFPETNIYEAYKSAEVLKQHINQVIKIVNVLREKIEKFNFSIQSIPQQNVNIKLTASMGLAFITGLESENITVEDLINNADKALYNSKIEGKNKITIWDEKKIYHIIK